MAALGLEESRQAAVIAVAQSVDRVPVPPLTVMDPPLLIETPPWKTTLPLNVTVVPLPTLKVEQLTHTFPVSVRVPDGLQLVSVEKLLPGDPDVPTLATSWSM